MQFKSLEEQVVYYALSGTWIIYFLGCTYLMPPVMGWMLIGVWAARRIKGEYDRRIPALVWVWIASMLVMEIALIAGHFNWNLPLPIADQVVDRLDEGMGVVRRVRAHWCVHADPHQRLD